MPAVHNHTSSSSSAEKASASDSTTCHCCHCKHCHDATSTSRATADNKALPGKDGKDFTSSNLYTIFKRNLECFHDTRLPLGLSLTFTLQLTRLLQFSLGLSACVVYSTPLHSEDTGRSTLPADPRWIFAVIISSISTVFAACNLLVPFRRPWWLYMVDGVLALNWMAVFGLFGKLYITKVVHDVYATFHYQRMQNMVWVDVCCTFLWAFTALLGIYFLGIAAKKHPKKKEAVKATDVEKAPKSPAKEQPRESTWEAERTLLIALLARLNGIELHDGKQSLHVKWSVPMSTTTTQADECGSDIPGTWHE